MNFGGFFTNWAGGNKKASSSDVGYKLEQITPPDFSQLGSLPSSASKVASSSVSPWLGVASAGADLIGNVFNYLNQQDALKYNKWLQKQVWQREDTAHQREVADLEAAGFNRALAVGGSGAGAGATVGISAPQFASFGKDVAQVYSTLQAKEALRSASLQNVILAEQINNIRLRNERLGLTNNYQSLINDVEGEYMMRDRALQYGIYEDNYNWRNVDRFFDYAGDVSRFVPRRTTSTIHHRYF